MTHNTEQRENCPACNGAGSGSAVRVFTYPEPEEDKKNTSAEPMSLAELVSELRDQLHAWRDDAERREALDALDALTEQAQELGMGYE